MGIQEKKQIREITEYLSADGLTGLKGACGSEDLSCEFLAEEAMNSGQIQIAGDNVKEFITGFSKTCEDSDYKEEIGNWKN
jgi:hypothetical protein